jgi:adenylate cyclase
VHEDDALRAVRTSLRMIESLARFNARRAEAGLPEVSVGIGVNTGEVISGNIGSEKRMDFTVIGDGVNVASRLEGLTKHYGTSVLISQSTRDSLGDAFVVRPVDNVRVKGRATPLRVFDVLGEKGFRMTAEQETFLRGFEAYESGDFRAALEHFDRAAGGDAMSRVFVRRCRQLIKDPPRDDWSGVWDIPTK